MATKIKKAMVGIVQYDLYYMNSQSHSMELWERYGNLAQAEMAARNLRANGVFVDIVKVNRFYGDTR